jgi:hypothetical protein
VNQTVPVAKATSDEAVLPERVQEALGHLVGAAKEGLLALSVEVGLGVLRELLEEEVRAIVGPKGKWNRDRTAVRHGQEDGEVRLGGRRVQGKRPRVRTADGESEVPLETYEHFAERDRLEGERMLAGVSTRQYGRAQEPVGEQVEADARSTSKSAASRMFVARTYRELMRLMSRPRSDLRLAVIMLDGSSCMATPTSSRWASPPRARSWCWGCGGARPRTQTVAAALLSDLVDRASMLSRACCS